MRVWLDSNVLVRYLTAEPPDEAARAANLIDGQEACVISPMVLAETFFVLTSFYKLDRLEVLAALDLVVRKDTLELDGIERRDALRALDLCRPSKRVSLVDALLWARVEGTADEVATFDKNFPPTRFYAL